MESFINYPCFVKYIGQDCAKAFDPDAVAYLAAKATADGAPINPIIATATNDFVVGCKDDGIWNDLKSVVLLAGSTTIAGALVPLKGTAPTNMNFVTADLNVASGLIGNGVDKYINTNRNTNADGQNDSHMAIYVSDLNNDTTSSTGLLSGDGTSVGAKSIGRSANGVNYFIRLTNSSAYQLASNETGFVGASRSDAASYSVLIGSGSLTNVTADSNAPNNETIYAYKRGAGISKARLGFYSIGEATDLVKFRTRVNDYMTAIAGL